MAIIADIAETQAHADQALAAGLSQGRDRKRAEAVHRLQIGAAGIAAMVLMIGLASVILERAQLTEAITSPDTAASAAPPPASPNNDPLAEAGVVPDMPSQAEQAPEQEQAIVPEQGNAPRGQ